MKIGIIGETMSGKSTFTRILMGEFGYDLGSERGRKDLFVVNVPDERVDCLGEIFNPHRKVYSTITFNEVPSGKEGIIDSRNVQALRNCDLLALIVPVFLQDQDKEGIDLVGYYRNVETEICLSDYMVAQKRLERLVKEGRKGRERDLLESVVFRLEESIPLTRVGFTENEKKGLLSFSFLSFIPIIVVANLGEEKIGNPALIREKETLEKTGVHTILLCGKLEEEVMDLDPGEREQFLKESGLDGFVMTHFLRTSYALLDLVSFFTVGEDEVRSWSVPKGTRAKEAAGKIHSDLERGFIRAEVISYDDFRQFNDMKSAKSAGKVRLEGKDYVVRDGDIITVRFNV